MEKSRAACRKWRAENPEKQKAATKRWTLANPERAKALGKAYRAAHPGKTREWGLNYRRRNPEYSMKRYGISLSDFIEMAVRQNAKCAICGKQEKLCVDHCHDSGTVRGLLCRQCNSAIGLLDDSIEILSKAKKYLKEGMPCSR